MSGIPLRSGSVLSETDRVGDPIWSRREFLRALGGAVITSAVPASVLALSNYERSSDRGGSSSEHGRFETRWHERMQPMMATFVSLAIAHDDRRSALTLLGECFAALESYIAELSNWSESSIVSKLNRERVLRVSEISPELRRMIEIGAEVHRATEGAFNLVIQPLTSLWRRAARDATVPDRDEIRSAVRSVRGSALQFSDSGVALLGSGSIDVGGIGKGLIADLACDFLRARGIEHARVACSGDLRFLGPGPWRVVLEDPFEESGDGPRTMRRLETRHRREITVTGDVGVSTSGGYRNFWRTKHHRYHHLIDPRIGEPRDVNAQVTVVARTGVEADGFASGLFFHPPTLHADLLRKRPDLTVLALSDRGDMSLVDGADSSDFKSLLHSRPVAELDLSRRSEETFSE